MPALCLHDLGPAGAPLALALFMGGLTGGVTHCAGMCGPFVLAQAGGSDTGMRLERLRTAALVPYHLGRITTYVMLAYVLSSFTGFIFINSPARGALSAVMLALAGVVFLVNAFPLLAPLFPWGLRFHNFIPVRMIEKASARFLFGTSIWRRYMLGLLLGFMPCGMVMAALLASASAPTAMHGALAMAAFGMGTVPALVVVAAGGDVLRRRWPAAAQGFSMLLIVASGVSLFFIAGTLVL